MVERDEVSSIERQMRELTQSTLGSEGERRALERAVADARKRLEEAKTELPQAERSAKECRLAQVDAVRGRAELERRLADLVEAEGLARTRRQQAEQRAQGFKAAAAFSGMARIEAENAGDAIRADRERLVEERALREGATADARAAEEQAEESRIGKLRAEVAGHVKAEREIEAAIVSERESFENRAAALRTQIERAGMELHEAEANLARTDADRNRLSLERTQADERLREVSKRARGEIEARIAELRAAEADLARERAEQETLLATLVDNEKRVDDERKAAERAEAERLEAEEAALKEQYERETATAVAAAEAEETAAAAAAVTAREAQAAALARPADPAAGNAAAPAADASPAPGGARMGSGALLDFSTLGEYSDASIQAEVDAQSGSVPAPVPAAPKSKGIALESLIVREDDSETVANYKRSLAAGVANRTASEVPSDEQLIPGFKSFIGHMFTRLPKTARPEEDEEPQEEPPESASIADRIARDFGLLGGEAEN